MAWAWQTPPTERTQFSQVMNAPRTYRIYLPGSYAASQKRYPVLYWFHGYESSAEVNAYSAEIASYVAVHEMIVVDSGPLETVGQFPLYFEELVAQVDKSERTLADREHRAVSGYSAGGFLAFYLAGKFPDLVGSASSFMGPTEYSVGPKDFDTEYNAEEVFANLEGVRTRLVTGSRDFIRFYHRRLNAVWSFAHAGHETEEFASEHGTPGVAKTLDFHMRAFANPLPKPAVFTHSDVYPNFTVWGWEVATDRRQPGFTVLENASASGFRCAVREWIPGGAPIPAVRVSIATARLYEPASVHTVTYVRLRDSHVRHATARADSQGRLNFELDGEAYAVGISSEAVLAAVGYEFPGGEWLPSGKPVKMRIQFLNAGAVKSAPATVQWETPDAGVKLSATSSQLYSLMPGETLPLPLTVTVPVGRAMLRIVAVKGSLRMPVDIPVFPEAKPSTEFQIADGRTVNAFQHATERAENAFGEGNGDGHAAPGETFAVLMRDGEGWRAAELFTADPCIDLGQRASDSWTDYDHTGASAKYSLAKVRKGCLPGTVVHLLARIVVPNAPDHEVRYSAIEFPIWYRPGEDPK